LIDTHCHLLAGLDDGPRSFNDSIRMARHLRETGVELVVCTPHYNARFPTPVPAAAAALERLADALATLEIPLGLRLAAELDFATALEARPADLGTRALAPGYVLVELVSATQPAQIDRVVSRLAELRLSPVFAHPERCRAVQQQPTLLDGARSDGALVQVVASSLIPSATAAVGLTGWALIEAGRVDLVASDAHRPDSRRLDLGPLHDEIARRYGTPAAAELLSQAPARLLGLPVADGDRERR
jgi:protein-tyrosine phosphatase